jgi:hypothetical protein
MFVIYDEPLNPVELATNKSDVLVRFRVLIPIGGVSRALLYKYALDDGLLLFRFSMARLSKRVGDIWKASKGLSFAALSMHRLVDWDHVFPQSRI